MDQKAQKSFGAERSKSGLPNGKNYNLPREIFPKTGQPDMPTGNRRKNPGKKSAEGVLVVDNHHEGLNLLTQGTNRRCVKTESDRNENRAIKTF